jgi:hypothetical protein
MADIEKAHVSRHALARCRFHRHGSAMTKPLTLEDLRAFLLALPGVEEGTAYGHPAFRVKGRQLLGLKVEEGAAGLRVGFDERDLLLEADPETFYVTDHYRSYPTVLIRIAKVDPEQFRRMIVRRWREVAPKALVKAFDAQNG